MEIIETSVVQFAASLPWVAGFGLLGWFGYLLLQVWVIHRTGCAEDLKHVATAARAFRRGRRRRKRRRKR